MNVTPGQLRIRPHHVAARRFGLEREDLVCVRFGLPDVLLFSAGGGSDVDDLEARLTESLVDQGVVADQLERGLQAADGPMQSVGQEAPDLAPRTEVAIRRANVG